MKKDDNEFPVCYNVANQFSKTEFFIYSGQSLFYNSQLRHTNCLYDEEL
jgi:hypothetical protein